MDHEFSDELTSLMPVSLHGIAGVDHLSEARAEWKRRERDAVRPPVGVGPSGYRRRVADKEDMLRDPPPPPKTEAELRARMERRRALSMTAANPTTGWKELANAFRETGRRLQVGKASNNAAIARLLIVRTNDRPIEGAQLQELLCAAESHEARGDRAAAIEQIRVAIDLSLAMADKAGKPVEPKQEGPGEEQLRIEAWMRRNTATEEK